MIELGARVATLVGVLGTLGCLGCSSAEAPAKDAGPTTTFAQASDAALATLKSTFYQEGTWELCVPTECSILSTDDFDWGADSLTAALYLRWTVSADASIPAMMEALDENARPYETCTAASCTSWSDVPLWDSIAASHEHLVTGSSGTLARSEASFAFVDTATQFALGACPDIDYQAPIGNGGIVGTSSGTLKTLETDSNYIKAALLLHQITGTASYLDKAVTKYAAVRAHFLDPEVPLYTVYVLDDGKTCAQIPRRFYGSVNGNMIWNGVELTAATGTSSYLDDAIATAEAVSEHLSDARGVYADLQTDDDVVEPLVEGMYQLATKSKQSFARAWLLTNAQAMTGARTPQGVYGRFFDGPPPPAQVTIWQANGGLALAFVAAALSPEGDASANADAWSAAVSVTRDLSTLPSSIQFTGQAIALFGSLGDTDYQLGQASVLVDGVETFDQTGIHQNQTNAFGPVPDSILFAWRWPTSGPHTLRFEAGPADPKDGGPFLHVQSYSYVP
jgi:hypothetical protein